MANTNTSTYKIKPDSIGIDCDAGGIKVTQCCTDEIFETYMYTKYSSDLVKRHQMFLYNLLHSFIENELAASVSHIAYCEAKFNNTDPDVAASNTYTQVVNIDLDDSTYKLSDEIINFVTDDNVKNLLSTNIKNYLSATVKALSAFPGFSGSLDDNFVSALMSPDLIGEAYENVNNPEMLSALACASNNAFPQNLDNLTRETVAKYHIAKRYPWPCKHHNIIEDNNNDVSVINNAYYNKFNQKDYNAIELMESRFGLISIISRAFEDDTAKAESMYVKFFKDVFAKIINNLNVGSISRSTIKTYFLLGVFGYILLDFDNMLYNASPGDNFYTNIPKWINALIAHEYSETNKCVLPINCITNDGLLRWLWAKNVDEMKPEIRSVYGKNIFGTPALTTDSRALYKNLFDDTILLLYAGANCELHKKYSCIYTNAIHFFLSNRVFEAFFWRDVFMKVVGHQTRFEFDVDCNLSASMTFASGNDESIKRALKVRQSLKFNVVKEHDYVVYDEDNNSTTDDVYSILSNYMEANKKLIPNSAATKLKNAAKSILTAYVSADTTCLSVMNDASFETSASHAYPDYGLSNFCGQQNVFTVIPDNTIDSSQLTGRLEENIKYGAINTLSCIDSSLTSIDGITLTADTVAYDVSKLTNLTAYEHTCNDKKHIPDTCGMKFNDISAVFKKLAKDNATAEDFRGNKFVLTKLAESCKNTYHGGYLYPDVLNIIVVKSNDDKVYNEFKLKIVNEFYTKNNVPYLLTILTDPLLAELESAIEIASASSKVMILADRINDDNIKNNLYRACILKFKRDDLELLFMSTDKVLTSLYDITCNKYVIADATNENDIQVYTKYEDMTLWCPLMTFIEIASLLINDENGSLWNNLWSSIGIADKSGCMAIAGSSYEILNTKIRESVYENLQSFYSTLIEAMTRQSIGNIAKYDDNDITKISKSINGCTINSTIFNNSLLLVIDLKTKSSNILESLNPNSKNRIDSNNPLALLLGICQTRFNEYNDLIEYLLSSELDDYYGQLFVGSSSLWLVNDFRSKLFRNWNTDATNQNVTHEHVTLMQDVTKAFVVFYKNIIDTILETMKDVVGKAYIETIKTPNHIKAIIAYALLLRPSAKDLSTNDMSQQTFTQFATT